MYGNLNKLQWQSKITLKTVVTSSATSFIYNSNTKILKHTLIYITQQLSFHSVQTVFRIIITFSTCTHNDTHNKQAILYKTYILL